MPPRRDLALDGFRGLAAISVLVFHVWLLAPANPSFSAHRGIAARVAHEGRLGLFLFFVLSGFLLWRPFAAAALTGGRFPSLRVYAKRRAARILPAYYVALVGSVALVWGARGTPGVSLPPAGKLWLFAVFGQNFSSDTVLRLNGPLWTLAVEAAFYVALPLAALLAIRQGRDRFCQAAVPLAAVGIGLAWNGWLARRGHNPPTLTLQLPAMLPYFGCGMLAAVVMHGRRLGPGTALRLAAAGAALALADAIWDASDASSLARHVARDLPGAAGFALLIAAAAYGSRGRGALAGRAARALGAISYGVYLWQVPIILAARHHRLLPHSPAIALLVVLPAVLIAAAASWFLVERPVLSWVRARAGAGAAGGAGTGAAGAGGGAHADVPRAGASGAHADVPRAGAGGAHADAPRAGAGGAIAPTVASIRASARVIGRAAARIPAAAYVALLAVLARVAYGPPYAEYDASYILIWGRDLAAGRLPGDFSAYYSPTPHPLANVVGAVLSALGGGALTGVEIVALLALGALAVAAVLLGTRLFGPAVGWAFAALLVTRPLVVKEALVASVDIPAMALVLGAAAMECGRRRRPWLVLTLLALAGLLRPEIWLLSAAYGIYAVRRAERGNRALLIALAAAGPVLWLAADLVVAGDALHSLHWTRFGAERLNRPRGLGHVVADGPRFASRILQPAVLGGALIGAALALRISARRAVLPLAVAVLGLGAFAAIGIARLAVLQRYLLIPAAMAALFCAVALLGWALAAERSRLRALWTSLALPLAVAIALTTPADLRRLSALGDNARAMHRQDEDLRALAGHIPEAAGCGVIQVRGYREKPLLAYLLDMRGGDVAIAPTSKARPGVFVLAVDDHDRPRGFRRVYANASWLVLDRCRA